MPERLECELGLLQKARYINTLTFYLLPKLSNGTIFNDL